jgi:hypothetical protein
MNHSTISPRTIQLAIALAAGFLIAAVAGTVIGSGSYQNLYLFFAAILVSSVCLALRQRIWLLMPACWLLTGRVDFLPLPLSVRDLSVLLVLVMFLALFALRALKKDGKFGWPDFLVALNVGYLLITFARNPVGLYFLGSDRVGGRPYFNVAIAVVAFWILKRVTLNTKEARFLPIAVLLGVLIVFLLGVIASLFPDTAPLIGMLYSGVDTSNVAAALYDPAPSVDRLFEVKNLGILFFLALCSYYRPLTLCAPIFPGRFLLFITSILAILLSGFRSLVAYSSAYFLLASYFRKGLREVLLVIMIGTMGLTFIAVANNKLFSLPLSAQRALSFLPGNWDYTAKKDAEGSAEWRFAMWREAFKGRFISDRVFGDGFGFSIRELYAMAQLRSRPLVTNEEEQEHMLIVGGFHSGPISTLRFVGIFGLILYYLLLIGTAIRAWETISIARGTAYFPVSLFVGLPLVWSPLHFTIIFGGYDSALPDSIFGLALLEVVRRSLIVRSPARTSNSRKNPLINRSTEQLKSPPAPEIPSRA